MKNFIFLSVFLLSITGFSQKTLPNISLKTFEGEKVSVAELSSNDKIAVISLWATWCVPCIKELDAINELYDEGHHIQFYTSRGTVSGKDWFKFTMDQLDSWGVKYHALKLGKPHYDLFVDDKAMSNFEWYHEEDLKI